MIMERPRYAKIGQMRDGKIVAIYKVIGNIAFLIATNATTDDLGKEVRIRPTSSLTCEIIR